MRGAQYLKPVVIFDLFLCMSGEVQVPPPPQPEPAAENASGGRPAGEPMGIPNVDVKIVPQKR